MIIQAAMIRKNGLLRSFVPPRANVLAANDQDTHRQCHRLETEHNAGRPREDFAGASGILDQVCDRNARRKGDFEF